MNQLIIKSVNGDIGIQPLSVHFFVCIETCQSLIGHISSHQQYSQKEDKYEEEIKILTDKLKEVRILGQSLPSVSLGAS